jgi:hypothetical protein
MGFQTQLTVTAARLREPFKKNGRNLSLGVMFSPTNALCGAHRARPGFDVEREALMGIPPSVVIAHLKSDCGLTQINAFHQRGSGYLSAYGRGICKGMCFDWIRRIMNGGPVTYKYEDPKSERGKKRLALQARTHAALHQAVDNYAAQRWACPSPDGWRSASPSPARARSRQGPSREGSTCEEKRGDSGRPPRATPTTTIELLPLPQRRRARRRQCRPRPLAKRLGGESCSASGQLRTLRRQVSTRMAIAAPTKSRT